MGEWLSIMGHSLLDIDSLNIVHVAGSKGKGTTCSLTSSLLQAHGERTGFPKKVGVFTTPILNHVTDMWRIDGRPVSDETCVNHFADMCDRFPQLLSPIDVTEVDAVAQGPSRFQLHTLFALHIFIREGIDAAVIECISGGECDSTNVVQSPLVTTVTPLGMDHEKMIGPSIENIAWHKAGIFKAGSYALARRQADPSIDAILQRRAREKGCPLTIFDKCDDERLPRQHDKLSPDVVRENAALALATADAFLDKLTAKSGRPHGSITTLDVQEALETWSWEGRFQVVRDGAMTLYMDGAHNEMSVPIAVRWFAKQVSSLETSGKPVKVLIFAQVSLERDVPGVFRAMAKTCVEQSLKPDLVVISSDLPKDAAAPKMRAAFEDLRVKLPPVWSKEMPYSAARVEVISSVSSAIHHVRRLASDRRVDVLLTGSIFAIGQVLREPGLLPGNGSGQHP